MSSIFGHSEAKSKTNNTNLGMLNSTWTPTMNQGVQAGGAIANMLGLNGPQGQNQAFDNWRGSTGYQFGMNEGMHAINGNAATQGLLNSGATAKALNTYGQNYADTQYGNYTNQLMGLLNGGLNAGNMLTQAGQQTTSVGGGKNGGVGGLIGSVAGSMLAK